MMVLVGSLQMTYSTGARDVCFCFDLTKNCRRFMSLDLMLDLQRFNTKIKYFARAVALALVLLLFWVSYSTKMSLIEHLTLMLRGASIAWLLHRTRASSCGWKLVLLLSLWVYLSRGPLWGQLGVHPIGRTWISDSLLSVTCDIHLGTTQPIGHTIRAAIVCHVSIC